MYTLISYLKLILPFANSVKEFSLTPDVIVQRGMLCDVYTVHALYLQYLCDRILCDVSRCRHILCGICIFCISAQEILYYTY